MAAGRAESLGAGPRDFDLDVSLIGCPCALQPGVLAFGELLSPGAQDVPDPVERVPGPAPVPVDVLLDPAADLIECSVVIRYIVERRPVVVL